jgi:hypothetical protein
MMVLPIQEQGLCKVVLFYFVRRLIYKIIHLQRFGSWIVLPSSGKKGGDEDRKPICWAPWLSQLSPSSE